MFAQVILGSARARDGLRDRWEAWLDEVAAGAAGWLASVGGVTPDGRLALATTFESADAAAASAARPEQDAWWRATAALLDGEPVVLETADVDSHGAGWPAGAGFVQMMRAKVSDRAAFEAVEAAITPEFLRLRPDVMAANRLWTPGGEVVAVDFFTSEEEARAGEGTEMPDALREQFGTWMSLLHDVEWFDLPDPWFARA